MDGRFAEFNRARIGHIERSLADLDGWHGHGVDGLREDYRRELEVRNAILGAAVGPPKCRSLARRTYCQWP